MIWCNIDEELIDEVKSDIANNIDQSKDYIQLLDADLVKAAIKKLKNDKCDVSGNFTSDCLKAAPDIFLSKLAELFKSFLTHGYISLNGDLLPWVETAKNLGNHLSSKVNFACYSPETRTYLLQKRAILFDKVHQIQQQFGYYNPRLVIKLLSIYSTALYGSNLWQIDTDDYQKLIKSWNIAVKTIWDLPHPTHTRYLESLSPVPHLEAVLTGRYLGFIQNLWKSKKTLLNLIFSSCFQDLRSLTGQNLRFLLQKHGKLSLADLIADRVVIKKSRVYPLPDEEVWKTKIIEDICLLKKDQLEIAFDLENLEDILQHICTS